MKTQTKTVKAIFNSREIDGWLYLIKFDDQYLALKRQADGRVDLVDFGCDDTGTDASDWSYDQLEKQITNWLDCIEASAEDKELAWEQVGK